MLYILGKLSAPGSQKSSHFLHRVKWRNAMYHNEIDTPCLSCNSEQMKIKAKFFHLGTWCHSFLWFETQSTVKKFSSMLKCANYCAFFKKNCLFEICLIRYTPRGSIRFGFYLWFHQLLIDFWYEAQYTKENLARYNSNESILLGSLLLTVRIMPDLN